MVVVLNVQLWRVFLIRRAVMRLTFNLRASVETIAGRMIGRA